MAETGERRAVIVVVLLAAAVAVISARPYAGSWNDGSRWATVECLVDYHTLAIDESIFVAVPAAKDPLAGTPYRGDALDRGTLDKLFIDGHFYSDKSPVPALLLAALYQVLQWLSGLRASAHPEAFCWWMTVLSSGVAYVIATVCIFRIGRGARLPMCWRLVLTASFGLATVAVVYVEHVNNHILLLGVAAALMLQATQLLDSAGWRRVLIFGSLAGLGYSIDLGAGPPLLFGAGLLVVWVCQRRMAAGMMFALGALPWLVLHHAVNYHVGGTLGPANAVPEYFNWEGCPFQGAALTGSWHHDGLADFLVYALALLFGRRGFVGHNVALYLLMPGIWLLWKWRPREWPVLLFGAAWCGGAWLAYAATSRNYSGACCSIRWLVPLLAPAYHALAVLLSRQPSWRIDFSILSAWGAVLMVLAWGRGPWDAHMGTGFWPIQAAALGSWVWLARRRKQKEVLTHLPRQGFSGSETPIHHVEPAQSRAA